MPTSEILVGRDPTPIELSILTLILADELADTSYGDVVEQLIKVAAQKVQDDTKLF